MEDNNCINLPANFKTSQTTTPTNINLYHKYEIGEIVEVEYEPNKYWLATIIYSFDQLNLLEWIGGYGEFWVDTSIKENDNDYVTSTTFILKSSNSSMRLHPPGYHKKFQSNLKFILEKPTSFLNRNFFNPLNDPYRYINTVEDLLAFENIDIKKETIEEKTNITDCVDAEMVIIENNDKKLLREITPIEELNAKVVFGQEDRDELQMALENIIDMIEPPPQESEQHKEKQNENFLNKQTIIIENKEQSKDSDNVISCNKIIYMFSDKNTEFISPKNQITIESNSIKPSTSQPIQILNDDYRTTASIEKDTKNLFEGCSDDSKDNGDNNKNINSKEIDKKITIPKEEEQEQEEGEVNNTLDEIYYECCKRIIDQAFVYGYYNGIGKFIDKLFYIKPKEPINEHFDLNILNNENKQMEIDYMLNEKSLYIRIYFNHKCFTGPSLSKGKICSLPQYVGPGPSKLVIEEIVSKIISVAYVPPRILNDLSSKTFNELLITRGLINTTAIEFKAKYQKRVHRECIQVCLEANDIPLYCECICEHLKCCYNLFGPNLYDGDDCPGHCRALTKSNKYMKRATYYREKARLGELSNNNNSENNANHNNNKKQASNISKTSRPRYVGRDSSESTSSSLSRAEQVNSRASSSNGIGVADLNQLDTNGSITTIENIKENLDAVKEIEDEDHNVVDPSELNLSNKNVKFDEENSITPEMDVSIETENIPISQLENEDQIPSLTSTPPPPPPQLQSQQQLKNDKVLHDILMTGIEEKIHDFEMDINKILDDNNQMKLNEKHEQTVCSKNILKQIKKPPIKWPNDAEFNMLDEQELKPFDWTVEDVAEHLEWCRLSSFKPYMLAEGVDGQALLLLDRTAIKEHFLLQQPKLEYSPEEVGKLCRFVEFVKSHAGLIS